MRVPVITLCAALALGACAPVSAPVARPSPAPSTAPSATPTPASAKLLIAYSNISGDFLPLWVAVESGIAKKNGLDLDARYVEGGSRTMAALLSGEINIGQLGGGESVSAAAGGADLAILATLAPVYPYVFMVRSEIKTIDDLKGTKVGISSVGGSADIATRVLFKSIGLDADKDVAMIALGSHATRTAALLSGSIQAAMDDPPDSYKLEAAGLRTLYDLAAKKLPTAQTVVVVQRSWLNANRAVAQRYIDSIVQSIALMRRDRAATVAVLKKYFKEDNDKDMNSAYDFFINEVVTPLPYPKTEQFTDAMAVLAQKNEKIKAVDLSKILDPSFVQSAADRGLDK